STDPHLRQEIRTELHLDQPVWKQLQSYLGKLLSGDFGKSWAHQQSTVSMVRSRLPASLQLAGAGLLIAVGFGVPLGMIAAARRGGGADKVARAIGLLGQSIPTFWLGIMLILVFAARLHWLPTSGQGGFKKLILPAVSVGWVSTASILRLTRSSMLN